MTQEILREKKDAEDAFVETMRQQQEVSEQWFSKNLEKKQELGREIAALEKRKQEALSPLLIKESDIQSAQEALVLREAELIQRKAEIEEESRVLMRRMDEYTTKMHDLDSRQKRVHVMEQGAATQRNQIVSDARKLNEHLASFNERVAKTEYDFAIRQSELDAQKNLYDEKDRGLVTREKEIIEEKRRIADQWKEIEKTSEELRKQHGNRISR